MDYKNLIEKLRFPTWYDLEEPDSTLLADAATAITDLLARAEAAEAENTALRRMQPVRLDDTSAQALTLAAEVSELKQKLEAAESEAERLKNIMRDNWILVIPSRYPGREKWNLPWRGQKEE